MIKEGALQLDSYRLAQYAVQVPCYICGGGNSFDAELCRHCYAPMALAHQVNNQQVHPQILAAIGASGAGKTVYLGMLLDMLSRQPDKTQLSARGAFSINLQQNTAGSLAHGEFPEKTPTEPDRWNWVHCQVRTQQVKRPIELIMPDLAGEALLEEVDHPKTFQVIRSLLSKCAGIMVLVDTVKLQNGAIEHDYFAMKVVSYLLELDDHPKHGWSQRPVALIFSKADEVDDCFLDPNKYAQTHASGLWQLCRERLKKFQFFASGVAGGCAYRRDGRTRVRIPLRIEPRGIAEPFEWLLGQLKT